MTYKIYFRGGAQAALVIVADTGLVANAFRWVSGRIVQYERIARDAGNAHIYNTDQKTYLIINNLQ